MKKFLIILLFMPFWVVVSAAAFPVTSGYGWRNDPFTGEWKFHSGVDLGYEQNTPIPALFTGVVVAAGDSSDGYGNCVLIYHTDMGAYTRYGHCAALYVAAGQQVGAGEIIALVGSTGRSTGPHLHLEYIIQTEEGYQYADPLHLWD